MLCNSDFLQLGVSPAPFNDLRIKYLFKFTWSWNLFMLTVLFCFNLSIFKNIFYFYWIYCHLLSHFYPINWFDIDWHKPQGQWCDQYSVSKSRVYFLKYLYILAICRNVMVCHSLGEKKTKYIYFFNAVFLNFL